MSEEGLRRRFEEMASRREALMVGVLADEGPPMIVQSWNLDYPPPPSDIDPDRFEFFLDADVVNTNTKNYYTVELDLPELRDLKDILQIAWELAEAAHRSEVVEREAIVKEERGED